MNDGGLGRVDRDEAMIGCDNRRTKTMARRVRLGCLGSLVVMVVVGAGVFVVTNALFAPWAFFMGGRFHVLPQWQGWGRMHSNAAGGDYMLYVRMTPTPSPPPYISTSVKGDAMLCTPKGERYHLLLGGGMARHLPLNTVGQPIHLYMHRRVGLLGVGGGRPRLDLRGVWIDGGIAMEDDGTLAREFGPDGSLLEKNAGDAANPAEKVAVTFTEASPLELWPRCPEK